MYAWFPRSAVMFFWRSDEFTEPTVARAESMYKSDLSEICFSRTREFMLFSTDCFWIESWERLSRSEKLMSIKAAISRRETNRTGVIVKPFMVLLLQSEI